MEHQPREREAPCLRCQRGTWNPDAICDRCREDTAMTPEEFAEMLVTFLELQPEFLVEDSAGVHYPSPDRVDQNGAGIQADYGKFGKFAIVVAKLPAEPS